MKLIGNIFLIPIKLIMLIALFILLGLNIIVSILGGLGNIFLNIIMGIFGILFIYQLVTTSNTIYDYLGIILLFLFFGFVKIILAFFPTTLGIISGQIGRGLAFWF
jgi:hypothetical protein